MPSPGPVRTTAARSIRGFNQMTNTANERAPIGRAIEAADVASLATFLASDGAAAITGQTIFVDGGFSCMA